MLYLILVFFLHRTFSSPVHSRGFSSQFRLIFLKNFVDSCRYCCCLLQWRPVPTPPQGVIAKPATGITTAGTATAARRKMAIAAATHRRRRIPWSGPPPSRLSDTILAWRRIGRRMNRPRSKICWRSELLLTLFWVSLIEKNVNCVFEVSVYLASLSLCSYLD